MRPAAPNWPALRKRGLNPRFPKHNWSMSAYNVLMTDVALRELIGMWRYELYNEFGWNAPPVRR